MKQRARRKVRLFSAMLVMCLAMPSLASSAESGNLGNLSRQDGVTMTVLAEGEVTANFYQGDPELGWSEIGLYRYQMTPGMAAESGPPYATPGDEESPSASIAYLEYGTVDVEDSQGNHQKLSAPAAIHDAVALSNSSFDCVWVLSATHTVSKSMGGGAFTDAPNMLLPASVPCDKSVEELALLKLAPDTPTGTMTAFIGEVVFEPGFSAENFSEAGFLGIVIERGDLVVDPNDIVDYLNDGPAFGIMEGESYSISADEKAGAAGLILGFIREPTPATEQVLHAVLPDSHRQRGHVLKSSRMMRQGLPKNRTIGDDDGTRPLLQNAADSP